MTIPKWFLPVVFGLVLLVLLGTCGLTGYTIVQVIPTDATNEQYAYMLLNKSIAIRSLQILSGSILGLFCVTCGIMLCWTNVLGAIELEAKGENAQVSIKSAQIGAVIIICGVILIGIGALSPQVHFTRKGDEIRAESGLNPIKKENKTSILHVPDEL